MVEENIIRQILIYTENNFKVNILEAIKIFAKGWGVLNDKIKYNCVLHCGLKHTIEQYQGMQNKM